MRVLIAGAAGFVGQHLISHLKQEKDIEIVATSRRLNNSVETVDDVRWIKCDMFSRFFAERAMRDVDVAIYLIHSMLPNAHLSQGRFEDFDAILADNFAKSAEKCGVKQIIYLSGLVPDEIKKLSPHLRSRLEVESIFKQSIVPATTLRASLVIGKDGSSFRIIKNLVKRLPYLVCPKWTKNYCQPIDISDVVRAISNCLLDESVFNKHYDIAGPDKVTYLQLMQKTAKAMKVERKFCTVPLMSARFSKIWVALFGGQSLAMVSPLIDSLKHSMVADASKCLPGFCSDGISLDESLDRAVNSKARIAFVRPKYLRSDARKRHSVRSVQRLARLRNQDAIWLSRRYMQWLDRVSNVIIIVKGRGEIRDFYLFGKILLLRLKLSVNRSSFDRQLFYIKGGLLDSGYNPRARIEFRIIGQRRWAFAAIHEYYPTLPWPIYKYSQAIVHKLVMYAFKKHIIQIMRSKTASYKYAFKY